MKLVIATAYNRNIIYECNANATMNDIIRIIIAIVLPPLGVFLQVGLGKDFWINILLTLLGYIPGLVHAIWIIAKK